MFSAVLLAFLILIPTVHAKTLSPGIEILAARDPMMKSGTLQAGISFTVQDFEDALAIEDTTGITVTSLPNPSDGILYLGNVPIAVNQSISLKNFNYIRFEPASGCTTSSFFFKTDGQYEMQCILKISDSVNFSPVISEKNNSLPVWTQKDITCYGTMQAYDPENDALVFEIVDYPKKGLLTLQNAAHGDFRYTPYVGCSGDDSFTYRVRDSYGNYSKISTKYLYIDRQNSTLTFQDMTDHWAHSAAIEMVHEGIMTAKEENNSFYFQPDSVVSREDFLVMVMKALELDLPEDPACITVFADDEDISAENKAFILAAYRAGIIHGRESEAGLCFAPAEPITRAETAVILNNILGGEVPVNATAFSDSATVPAWAQSAFYAVNSLGIMSGTGSGSISPFLSITRAQAAQILLNMRQYINQPA